MSEIRRIRIGPWTVSPALNLIERGARSIKIEPRAMDVLVYLATHSAAVSSVDDLIASVWKGAVVGDGSVYLAIKQLRRALEDPDAAPIIETIPKRGYRLTVPVEVIEPAPATAPSAPSPPAVRPRIAGVLRGRWGLLGVAAVASVVVVLVVVAHAFVWQRDGARPPAAQSVAVLPFANLSADREQQYFADGVTVEILSTLARLQGLRVAGRASSYAFENRREDLRSVGEAAGKALGVEHVLEGSVRRVADRVRVTAQLSSARTGEQLWSETYERTLDDIFAIQDEIAAAVATALEVKLAVGDLARVPGMTRDVAAYDEYLRGMALNLEWRPESFPLAIAHFERAVALDPSFSLAWAGLNTACTNGAIVVPDRASEWLAKGSDALSRARALTPDAPHVLLEIGIREARRGQWSRAAAVYGELEAAYARYGMNEQAWGPHGVFLLGVGRAHEALPALERARADEPLAPAFAGFLSQAESAGGDLVTALAEVDRGLGLEGLDPVLQGMGLAIALARDDRAEIEERLRAMPDRQPGLEMSRSLARFMSARAGAAAEIRRLAPVATRDEKLLLAHWAAYYDEPELSLELLSEVAPHLGHPAVLWQPLFRDVRKLSGFKNLVRDLGLLDYWRRYGWSDFCRAADDQDFVCA